MAKINSSQARKSGQNQSRAILLAVLLAALTGWNLNAWLMPLPGTEAPDAPQIAAAPEPWLASRAQQKPRQSQETTAGPAAAQRTNARPDTASARFAICGAGTRVTCVVDGDTFWLNGTKIRIADIDTPEVSSPKCAAELQRGRMATQRLTGLLNAGPFTLEPADRAQDRYGRALYVVTRGGTSVGGALVDEGLAVWYGKGRPDWC